MRWFSLLALLINSGFLSFYLSEAFTGEGIIIGAGAERLASHGSVLLFAGFLAMNVAASFYASRPDTLCDDVP